MKYPIAISLLCISSVTFARSWQESFDEAIENKSKNQCESTYERMNSQCDIAGIFKGGQNMNAVYSCRSEAKRLQKNCVRTIDENAATAAEEAAEKKAERDRLDQEARDRNQEARDRKSEVDQITNISRGRSPDIELSCTRVSAVRTKSGSYTYNPITYFDQIISLQVYNGGACYGSLGSFACSVSTGTISGYSSRKGSLALSRVTGMMSLSGKYDMEATYSCQRVSATTNKF